MYEVDLLKGQGIPVRFRPESAVMVSATIILPAIIAIALIGLYLHNSVLIAANKQRIESFDKQTARLTDASSIHQAIKKEHAYLTGCLSEVNKAVSVHTQWSPILQTIAETLPPSIQLSELRVEQRSIRKKVPKKNDPTKTVTVTLPVRTLHLIVNGPDGIDSDRAVDAFREKLALSDTIGPKLENTEIAKETREDGGASVTSYEISCVFRPEE